MASDSELPGFADRPQRTATWRRLVLLRSVAGVAPLVLLALIDLTGWHAEMRLWLLLLPFVDLRRQVVLWYRFVRRFGWPKLVQLRSMLHLDRLRGHNPLTNDVTLAARGSVGGFAVASLAVAGLGWIAWKALGASWALYPGAVMLMLTLKGLVRRARPPAVLVLGASKVTTSRFLLRIMGVTSPPLPLGFRASEAGGIFARILGIEAPLGVAACLRHEPMGALLDDVLGFYSFRTGRDSDWREMVASLIKLSPVVVLDVRDTTLPVSHEIELALATVRRDRLFFVGDDSGQERLPRDRCFSEGSLVEVLHVTLWGEHPMPDPPRGPAVGAQWLDRRNGYFAWTPPRGWVAQEVADPRTKVVFLHPTVPGVFVRFIVKEDLGGAGHTPPEGALAKAASMGAVCRVTQESVLGVPCSEIRITEPVTLNETVLWLFEKCGLHFNVSLTATSANSFQAHHEVVRRALETIVVAKEPWRSPAMAHSQHLAQRLRYVRLAAESIGVQDALRELHRSRLDFADDPAALAEIDRLQTQIQSDASAR